jgi:hypothetical protein
MNENYELFQFLSELNINSLSAKTLIIFFKTVVEYLLKFNISSGDIRYLMKNIAASVQNRS